MKDIAAKLQKLEQGPQSSNFSQQQQTSNGGYNQNYQGNRSANKTSNGQSVCNYCSKPGHFARDCRSRLRDTGVIAKTTSNYNSQGQGQNYNQSSNRYQSDKGAALQNIHPVYLIQTPTTPQNNYLTSPPPMLSLPAPPEATINQLAQQLCNQLALNQQPRP